MHYYLRKSIIFFFILLLLIEFSSETDTLSTGQELRDGDFLISAKQIFALGFFSPGMSPNRYLGIWYYNLRENRVVWVANRDNPVEDTFGVLSFNPPNNLVIHEHDLSRPIWSTGFLGRPGKNYSAQLLDTGNLVVFEKGKKGVIKWQSFDHPTNTWLPNMKLGVNRKTGLNSSLTSWKSNGDPGSGNYSLRMEVIREFSELSLYEGSNRRWRTGPLNGARLGEMLPMSIFNITYVDNEDEIYLTYSIRERSTFSAVTVLPFGFMSVSKWNPDMLNWTMVQIIPNEVCDIYNFCGPNRYCDGPHGSSSAVDCACFLGFEPNKREKFGGCVRKRDRNVCRNGEGFIKLSNMKMPDTTTARMHTIRGTKECKEDCLRDCNCTAYAIGPTKMGNACVMWYGNLLDTRKYQTGGDDLFVRVDAAELGTKQLYY